MSLKMKLPASKVSVEPVATDDGEGAWYAFNLNGGAGFVIVDGAEDTVTPVLGYSYESAFYPENLSDGVRTLLANYTESAREGRVAMTSGLMTVYGMYQPVEPLLGGTEWDQSAPYNGACPVVTSENVAGTEFTGNAAAGCVPVAMAQIMRYHKHPSSYDWSIMLDEHNDGSGKAANDEMARLIHDAGVSVGASYGYFSTSASSSSVKPSLVDDFGYSQSMVLRHGKQYASSAIDAMVYEEIASGRPVYYAASSRTGGHAFVCDGMDSEGYLHVNWGWGGLSNGYFVPYMLNPRAWGIGGGAGGYNSDPQIMTGLRKARTGDLPMNVELLLTDIRSEDGLTFDIGLRGVDNDGYNSYIYYMTSIPGADYGIRVVRSADGMRMRDMAGVSTDVMLTVADYTLADGEYRLLPIVRYGADEEWQYVWPSKGCVPYLELTVSGGKKRVSRPTTDGEPALTVTNVAIPGVIDPYGDGQIAFEVSNSGGCYYGDITMRFAGADGGVIEVSMTDNMREGIDAGATVKVEVPCEKLLDYRGRYTDGSYSMVLVDENGKVLTDAMTVRIASRCFAATEIKCPELRRLLTRDRDLDGDGWFSDYEIVQTNEIWYEDRAVTTLDGVEHFTEVSWITVTGADLREVRLSGLEKLQILWVDVNPELKSIEIKDCPALHALNAYHCGLTELEVSGVAPSFGLTVGENKLKSLDLRGVDLSELSCYDNQIVEIKVDGELPALRVVEVQNNRLAELKLPVSLPALERLNCSGNGIASIEAPECPQLWFMDLSGNLLEKIELKGCPGLTQLRVDNNQLTELELENHQKLQGLSCGGNKISRFDISSCLALEVLGAYGNPISMGDFRKYANLRQLNMSNTGVAFVETSGEMEYLSFTSESAVAFDADGVDLTPYIAQGMDVAKIHHIENATLKGCKLVLTDTRRPEVSYIYGGDEAVEDYSRKITLCSDKVVPYVDKTEIVLQNIGDEEVLTLHNPANIGYGLTWDVDSVIEADCEYIYGSYGGYTGIVGERYVIRRVGEGDVTMHFTAPGARTEIYVRSQSGIEDVAEDTETEREPVAYYDLSGRRLKAPAGSGVTLVIYSDGTVRKVAAGR